MLALALVLVSGRDTADERRWRTRRISAMVQHELALPPSTVMVDADRMPLMLLCLDLPMAHENLLAGRLRCPHANCAGSLGPWGWARARTVRVDAATTEPYTPRRSRCRVCHGTHILAAARTFPRRPDTAATIGAALLASSTGLGHRRVADQLGLPPTTVRGWLRRAHANADDVWSIATRRAVELDPMIDPFTPAGPPLIALVGAIGDAIAAYVRRVGPVADPWGVAVVITRGCLLAPTRTSPTLVPPDTG